LLKPPRTWRRSQSAGRPTWRYRIGNPERLPALSSLPPPGTVISQRLCRTFGGNTATCGVSCGRVDGRLDVHHRRPVDGLQGVEFNPEPGTRHDAGPVQPDRVRPVGRTGTEHAGQRLAHVAL